MPLVSVIIPTYDRSQVIGDTIQSVLNQTFQDFEIIVVDDGSIDFTKEVVEQFKSDKIRYIFQENQGAQVARNNGMSMTTGKYIAFLDSDDVWLPSFLEELLQGFSDKEVGCVYCAKAIKKKNGDIFPVEKRYLSGWVYKEALEQKYIASPSFMLVSRECVNKVGNWDVAFSACQDDDFCLRIAKYYKVKYIPKVLALYCEDYVGSDNRICKSSRKLAHGGWLLCEKFKEDIIKFCGLKVLVLHYLDCARCFYDAGMSHDAQKAIDSAISCYGSKEKLVYEFEHEIADFMVGEDVFCYGAGDIGALVADYMNKRGYRFKAFIVSKNNLQTTYLGYPVVPINDIKKKNCKIVISTTETYHEEIEDNIKIQLGDVPIYKMGKDLIDYLRIGFGVLGDD
ncbi:glycosyltransferase family 2 protein [Schwartzia succinivorans]|uniref:Glycosyl transferase family 2 n=1 Tax=Schwartzia succinivorans DSM 10502 TaxID=1123243 RepID=A0A1M4SML4_9FIRM|nr:glycosyltransferase family 2 protein [Schwartzia succinivorans]SHE33409.1 Glycosyl transferase family 2 [Schwartzia succinivorans DSM 10502]